MVVDSTGSASSLGVKLNILTRINRQIGHITESHANLKLAEWRIIDLIANSGSICQTDIRTLTGMDKGQISRTVRSLLSEGHIRKETGLTQVRNAQLGLTRKGSNAHISSALIIEEYFIELMSCLADDQKQTLLKSIDLIDASFTTRTQDTIVTSEMLLLPTHEDSDHSH